jgi:hypothetical protein
MKNDMAYSDSSSGKIDQAVWIGHSAVEALANLPRPDHVKILGTTSRGVFVLCGTAQVIFLSKEYFRGPWTINFAHPQFHLPAVAPGSVVEWDGQAFWFDSGRSRVRISGAQPWVPPSRPAPLLPPERVMHNLKLIASKTIDRGGFAPLLASLADLPESPVIPEELHPAVCAIHRLTSTGDDGFEALESLLGIGRGLTPSGDDFIAGFLLACSRWLPHVRENSKFPALIEQAYRRTTTLSANLIESAGKGSADERILAAGDALFCGVLDPENGASHALAYGSSSGVDALAGMATAFLRAQALSDGHRDL